MIPEVGSIWRHNNGNEYIVYDITNTESDNSIDYPVMISYRRLSDGTTWSRPIKRWYGSFRLIEDLA